MIPKAVNQLSSLWLNNPALRNAITQASGKIDPVLGIGPPNQGIPSPRPGYPTRREIAIDLLTVGFHYASNGVEVVVTDLELNPGPPHGYP
jgi:hypothetical protein